jgi:hypothetical protein
MDDERIRLWWNLHHLRSKMPQRQAMALGMEDKSRELLEQIILPVIGTLAHLNPQFPIYWQEYHRILLLDFAYIHAGQKINFERDDCSTIEDYQLAQRRDRYLLTQGWRVIRYQDEDFGHRLPQTLAMTHKLLNATSSTIFDLYEQAIIQYAVKSKHNIFRISEIISHLNIGRDRLRPILRRLYEKKILLFSSLKLCGFPHIFHTHFNTRRYTLAGSGISA